MPKIPTPTAESTPQKRLAELLDLMSPCPEEWLRRSPAARGRKNGDTHREPEEDRSDPDSLGCTPCSSYRELIQYWRRALRWTDGLDHALTAMLASISSTKTIGDQLWLKVIGPAGCGKSTLCEALSVNTEYVLPKSTIRGFHSGFREEGADSGEDNSLVSLLYDKTLIVKDGDSLLSAPNLGQILSEARDIYDGTSRTHYRNKASKEYTGLRMTWILCGTSSLRAIDSSELGERFLDVVIMEGIDDELEDEVLERVVYRTERSLAVSANGEAASHYEPSLRDAMQATGGYVGWLRENSAEALPSISVDQEAKERIIRLGKFVSYMRARPSDLQDETSEREFAARLVSQLLRLSVCLAYVMNKDEVDHEVLARVCRVALDTSRGQTLEITSHLSKAGGQGLSSSGIALLTNRTEEKTKSMLRFLRHIRVVELFQPADQGGVVQRKRWRLTPLVSALYDFIVIP